jgi:hypothetical protein
MGLESESSDLALTSNQLARRWRECRPLDSKSNLTSREGELWRRDILKCLSAAHTVGNFADMSFEVVKSLYSVSRFEFCYPTPPEGCTNAPLFRPKDFAFELRLDDFVFRWETNTTGHRISAEVISRQIIMPLMSTAHLAFSSPNSVGVMSESELETVSQEEPLVYALMIRCGLRLKAVDKLGRAARRTPGLHARNAISRPRLATSIRRMTAMLNFLLELRECGPLP